MRRAFVILTALAAWFVIRAARNDRWQIIGPGGGGAQFYPAISPHDPQRVLEACDMTGSYFTEDGGSSWRMFNLRGVTRFFVWDPNQPQTIYAANDGLYRSTDAGKTWRLVYPSPAQVTGIEMSDDHAGESILTSGKPAERVAALAIDPADSKVLYAGIGRTLRVSEDAGASWHVEREFAGPVRRVWATKDAVHVALERAMARREHGAWSEGEPLSFAWTDIAGGPPVFYAISERDLALSEDGGKTWRVLNDSGPAARLHAVAVSPNHPDFAYVSFDRLEFQGQSWFGVAKTTDRGKAWSSVWQESGPPAPNLRDAWITPRFGSGWGGHPLSLGVSPSDPDIVYATDLGRTMRTKDGGKTWEAVYSRRSGDGWTTTGLDVTTCYGVHFDPFDSKRMFITYTDIGAFRSEDGGRSWIPSTEGVPRLWVNTTYWMVFDPEVNGRVWAVASGTHDLPRPKMWRRTAVSTYRGGVIQSDNGGRIWHKASDGIPETAATHILLDPKSPKSARTLYVSAFGKGVYKSTDGGANWTLKNDGIAGAEPFAWRLSRASNGDLYLVVARRSEDGGIGNDGDGGLYTSADGAGHWKPVKLPDGVNGPNGLTVDPADPKRLYLAAWQRRGQPQTGGIFLSDDAGAHWRNVLQKDQHIYDVTLDPKDPRTLYASGFESSAWRSNDRGEHWQRIKGYNFKWGHRVVPDPTDLKSIYITTFGGSVWHGPGAGDPTALEDIAGPTAVSGK